MIALLKASRLINLSIVGLTQFIFYYIFFLQYKDNFDLTLYPSLLFPFIAVTILIAAGGYYINDYFDYHSDIVNAKSSKLSNRNTYILAYFIVVIIGWVLSYSIAYVIGRISLSLIYLVAVGLLFLYSSYLKKVALIGNVVVSMFSAFVLLIIIYSEYSVFQNHEWQDLSLGGNAVAIICFYSAYIFILSFLRELIKDIEDVEGDSKIGYNTYPIKVGVRSAKIFSIILSVILLLLGLYWMYFSWENMSNASNYFFVLCILISNIFLPVNIASAKTKIHYNKISRSCKLLMLSGLIYIILIAWT